MKLFIRFHLWISGFVKWKLNKEKSLKYLILFICLIFQTANISAESLAFLPDVLVYHPLDNFASYAVEKPGLIPIKNKIEKTCLSLLKESNQYNLSFDAYQNRDQRSFLYLNFSLVTVDYYPAEIENKKFIDCAKEQITTDFKINIHKKEVQKAIKKIGYFGNYQEKPLKILLRIDYGYPSFKPSDVNKAIKQSKNKK